MVADALSCRVISDLRVMFARLSLFDDGSLLAELQGRVCVLNDSDLKQLILREAHSSPYVMHPDRNKMYQDLCELYWWLGLKRKKWERVTIDFVSGLPLTPTKKDFVWVIMDRSRFLRKLYEALGSRLNFSTAFHPQTDGQSEKVIRYWRIYFGVV
ncbi:uncharacterized protein LOC128282117 [Gossypium arboreum]|uniref:uncharacterized protein LOC128282117 n=1 Tax=Gossypium arboreum TaxID=29729 RepID=UPI0022F1B345|nr:uncharacterized protein LOC128282117 [Gossypium arboreum]